MIAWAAPNDAGFEFETAGANRRVPVDLDGFRLVSFLPESTDQYPVYERSVKLSVRCLTS